MMYSVELFLEHWSNTIGLLNGLASFLIAWLIFRAEQRISEDKTRYLFLSVLDEAGMQLSIMERFSQSLNEIAEQSNFDEICNRRDFLSFLSTMYKAKGFFSERGVRSCLQKLQLYGGLFDEYRLRRISLLPHSKKVGVQNLFQYLNTFEAKMQKCAKIQADLSDFFRDLTVFFKNETSDVANLIYIMEKCPTKEDFVSEMRKKRNDYAVTPNWDKAKSVYDEFKQTAEQYAKLYQEAKNISDSFCKEHKITSLRLSAQVSATRG